MKILYFGTVCEIQEYEKLLLKCRTKPSVAPIIFENALLSGMKLNEADVTVYSFPMIPTFPNSQMFLWGNKSQKLTCGYECTWLRTINIPFLKQISRRIDGRKAIKEWIISNKNEKCVILTYSIPPFLAKDILYFGKKYNVRCYAIVADLLRDMYMNQSQTTIKAWIQQQYIKPALSVQGQFDGYIYLTSAMSDVINSDKPFVVMEGIADTTAFDVITSSSEESDSDVTAIMYAGGLYEKYGIVNLLDAFESLELPDVQLWLFGNGTAVELIEKRGKENRNIRYMGCLERREILMYERKASLLVNPRSVDEEFTKYSFPSKTIEFMLSGTPLLTTKLPGIPEEYFSHVLWTENNSVEALTIALKKALAMKKEQRISIGTNAQNFILNKKNAFTQAKSVLDFISRTGE